MLTMWSSGLLSSSIRLLLTMRPKNTPTMKLLSGIIEEWKCATNENR